MADEATQTDTEPTLLTTPAEPAVGADKNAPGTDGAPQGADAKPGDKSDAGAKPAEEADGSKDTKADGDADAGVPETYQLQAPEGSTGFDQEDMDLATPILKELGLKNDQAQKLAELQGQLVQRQIDRQFKTNLKTAGELWMAEAKADPEIGGAKLPDNLRMAQLGIEKCGGPKLRVLLEESRLGNHPEIIRAFARAGALFQEDQGLVRGGANHAPKSDAEVFWGNPSPS